MLEMLLLIFVLVILGIIAAGFQKRGGIYEYPFVAAWVFGGFVLLQLVGLCNDPDLPKGGLERTAGMSILCLAACALGFQCKWPPTRSAQWEFDYNRMLIATWMFTAVGGGVFFFISRLPEEQTTSSQWSGAPVASNFFAVMLYLGFAMALLMYLKTKSKAALAAVIFASLFYLDRIVIAGKRSVTVELFYTIVLAIWFVRRFQMPRTVMAVLLLIGVVGLYSGGQYRQLLNDGRVYSSVLQRGTMPTLDTLKEITLLKNIAHVASEGGPEMRNTVHYIRDVADSWQFDFGAYHWNALVFNFVPAQLAGADFKESLKLNVGTPFESLDGYEASVGSTFTGITDAFGSFWYFGCLKFFFIALVMRWLYARGQAGDFPSQLFYLILFVSSLHAITHQTQLFFSKILHAGIFLLPALWFVRAKVRPERALAACDSAPRLELVSSAGAPTIASPP